MAMTAKIFMSGRSRALRLPARLRLTATQVRIEQVGNDFWVHPEVPIEQDMGAWLQAFYASSPALPEEFLSARQDPPPQERDWS